MRSLSPSGTQNGKKTQTVVVVFFKSRFTAAIIIRLFNNERIFYRHEVLVVVIEFSPGLKKLSIIIMLDDVGEKSQWNNTF